MLNTGAIRVRTLANAHLVERAAVDEGVHQEDEQGQAGEVQVVLSREVQRLRGQVPVQLPEGDLGKQRLQRVRGTRTALNSKLRNYLRCTKICYWTTHDYP